MKIFNKEEYGPKTYQKLFNIYLLEENSDFFQ